MTSPTTTVAPSATSPFPTIAQRLWSPLVAGWAGVTGIAPHALHHVGPLAGTALVAGTGGQLVFGFTGFVATIPILLKLRRRFRTWVAPAVAITLFRAVFSFSTFVIGPRISSATRPSPQVDANEVDDHRHPAPRPARSW